MLKPTQRNLFNHHPELFAGSTVAGPHCPEVLARQLHAAGMTAAAWMVEDMIRGMEDLAGNVGLEEAERVESLGAAEELTNRAEALAEEADRVSTALSQALYMDDQGEAITKALDAYERLVSLGCLLQELAEYAGSLRDALDK